MRWRDVVTRDLKKCNLTPNWHDIAHEPDIWRAAVKDGTIELNHFLEVDERKKKDELMQR